eukprot:CAMPEP_0115111570 /NCGR_PEP_ID=MMETSP0227-20121206/40117_1 /TAXON_ID=89957 /ORGANISM="Polarella glacialis, Strain CCMP 1383" /LENGTH=253 /DNA_ID=CAMNT_0002510959 /DNA_START=132 /DNA_END=894 /DNA_ORIENTATION=+
MPDLWHAFDTPTHVGLSSKANSSNQLTAPEVQHVATQSSVPLTLSADMLVGSRPEDTDLRSDQGSAGSTGSFDSWISPPGDHCFLPESLFKMASDGVQFLLPALMLVRGSTVEAADGMTVLEVTSVRRHQTQQLTELQAGDATIRITPNHRIVTAEGAVALAMDLRVGDYVLCSSGLKQLTSVETWDEEAEVFAITFSPATFLPPPGMVLSLGQAASMGRTRRSGMNRRGQHNAASSNDMVSIPDTAPGAYQD